MDQDRIDQILDGLKHRTSWGICLDIIELTNARKDAQHTIELLDIAFSKVDEFVSAYMPNPKTPKDKEE